MDQEAWLSCEKTAILQGGFLLANQLCQPEPLSTLRKEDWKHVGQPIVQSITEICEQLCAIKQDRLHWRKRILCILWSKILVNEKGEDIDLTWVENPLFAVQNSLPDINHTVMFEIIKSLQLFSVYVELLRCFEVDRQCKELERLVLHVKANCTEADVKFLLEVWWDLIKRKREKQDELDHVFTVQCVRLVQRPTDCSPQASKRFKPDPYATISNKCQVSILFQALTDIKGNFTSSEFCHFALSNVLDMLYTFYLLNHETTLLIEVKLQNIALFLSLKTKNRHLEEAELIQEICMAHRDLTSILVPAESKPCGFTLIQAIQTAIEIIGSWEDQDFLKMPKHNPDVMAIRLRDSLGRVITSLEQQPSSGNIKENEQVVGQFKRLLENLLERATFQVPDIPAAEIARLALAIIDGNLQGFQDLPKLFASKLSQTCNEPEWLSCLMRNKSKFQQKDLVMDLVSSLIAKSQTSCDLSHCKQLKNAIVDIFTQLPLSDKNEAISEMLTISKKGLHGCVPGSVLEGFDEELNLAFNCIIQGKANSSLSSAVSSVARVAFQNPEATMHRCCHMAVVNLGAHTLFAQILQQLSGLSSSFTDFRKTKCEEQNLLCMCLQDTVWRKLSSPQDEDQFLGFMSALMEPSISDKNGEQVSFIPPEKAVHAFVLPYLCSSLPQPCNIELSLRLLQLALNHKASDDTIPWIMNCSPFALLYCLVQLMGNCNRCWEQPLDGDLALSLESKELLISIVNVISKAVGKEVLLSPSTWSRALSWLYGKVADLDWTVRFYLKEVWGEHFKNEVPSSLMTVCELSDNEWSGSVFPQYAHGTGLLAWIECCCISDHVQETMLDSLSLNINNPEEMNMFSKGLMVSVTQVLPWCTIKEWQRLLKVLNELLQSERLYVPYSLEYVDFLPLLNLRPYACDLRLSAFLLRMFQLLCGCSCADWLPVRGWAHVGRLYAAAIRNIITSVKGRLPLESSTSLPKEENARACGQEALFVLAQLFCHVIHVQVMMSGQQEPLFLCALDILSHYESVLAAYPKSSTKFQTENTRHFLTTISDNVQCTDMKAVLQQKIAQL